MCYYTINSKMCHLCPFLCMCVVCLKEEIEEMKQLIDGYIKKKSFKGFWRNSYKRYRTY